MAAPVVYKSSNIKIYIGASASAGEVSVPIPLDQIKDIQEDGEIRIEIDRPSISKTLDNADGGIFNERAGFPAKVTIPIMMNSQWIPILESVIMASGMVSLTIEDTNKYAGAYTFFCSHTMIQKPNVVFGAEVGSIEYEFEAMNVDKIPVTL